MMFFLAWLISQDTIQTDSLSTVTYQARQITFDLNKSLVILNDSSVITYQDIVLYSDSAYYFIDSNQLRAFGACHLKQVDDSIKGSYLVYNIETKKAMMETGTTQIDKGFMEGEKICWVSDKEVNAYDGRYTTCSDSPPHYYFYSPRMKVYLGDMVIARPIFLYIYDLPVLAAPFWFVPISNKRKSGLLPFKIGNSRTYGKYIRGFAYYHVLSDFADATLQLDAYEKKGIMPQAEAVWDYNPFSAGSALATYIKETDSDRVRYSIAARDNSPYFLLGSSFNCDIKYSSDNQFRSDYAETTTIWVEREMTSTATVSRDIGSIKNTLSMERRVVFQVDSTYDRFPHYTVATPSRSLLSLITYSLTGHVNRDRTASSDSGHEVSGANLHATPTAQQNIMGLFSVSPSIDMDAAVFDADTTGNKYPTRFGYSCGLGVNTTLFRLFPVEAIGIHGILHRVTPSAAYSWTPDFADYGRFPAVSGIPLYGKQNRVSFGLNQEFEAKVGENNDKKNFLRINAGSAYDLYRDSLAAVTFSANLPLNPFPKPVTAFTNRLEGSYNIYTKEYTYTATNGLQFKTDYLSLTLGQSYTKGGQYQFWFNGDIKPTRNWLVAYSGRYDYETKKLVDYSIGLTRNLHCWEGVFTFSQLADNWRYDFKVRIKEIPEIQIGRGLLGYLLE